jgi:hypothetical protein
VSQVHWLSPSPLWDDLVGKPTGFRAPALLRFAGDDFIPQYQAALETEPRTLKGFVARPETWREPQVGLDTVPSTKYPLRLYQPVHGRFYLVAASLACRVPGLPEHTVDAAGGDVVAFVVRKLTVSVDGAGKETGETGEWGWVQRADGTHGWTKAGGQALLAGEETLPLFSTGYTGAGGLKGTLRRRVFAGLVPASRRESYANAREAPATPPTGVTADDPRVMDFVRGVVDPWVGLSEWWEKVKGDPNAAQERQTLESSSGLVVLELAEFLDRWLKPVLQAAISGNGGSLPTRQKALYDRLAGQKMWTQAKTTAASRTFAQAIRDAWAVRAGFDALLTGATQPTVPAGFSPVVFLDPLTPVPAPPVTSPPTPTPNPGPDFTALAALVARPTTSSNVFDRPIAALVRDALAEASAPATLPQLPPAAPPDPRGDDWFVVRCVYLRPQCGTLAPPIVSDRSERFRLASFFEPEAPARQLRVALPVDTSPATLRKYDRNVAFMLSDQLRKQMSRASSLKGLMDGEAGAEEGGLDFAVICSFSIPIITICALILLMIIVVLLNIVFWWLPFFKVCFPVPKRA